MSRSKVGFAGILVALTMLWSAMTTGPLVAEEPASMKGVALVIGQSKYENIAALPNPANDAREMVKLLTDLGFDARSVTDRDAAKLKRDLERFVEDAEGADVAFLYYSGHGIESGGENWLIPVNADVSSLDDAQEALVPLSAVMDELKAVVPVTIMLLDACRTNPFPLDAIVKKAPGDAGAPIGAGGLTPVRGATAIGATAAPSADNLGTVIGFAAEPGRPALDGPAGQNSPYASALLRHLGAMNGLEFGQVMRMVTEEVYLDTRTEQRPWVNESLRRLLYFGVPQEEPVGDDARITGERRQLLLTISDLPDLNRSQVETVAAKDGVPLDALYGVLRALGESGIPDDPGELEKVLQTQAERLKKMIAERDALSTDDPELKRLTAAADRAIREGAIVTAREFLDEAVKRVEATASAVDAAEELVKQKRIADAAVYAQRAATASLAFDFGAAASDYAKAFELIEKWDDKLRWNYKNLEAEALSALGDATGDADALQRSLKAYDLILSYLPAGEKSLEWATTRNNQAVVLQTIGENQVDSAGLEEAIAAFGETLEVFAREKDYVNWSAAQNNIGNGLLKLGERQSDTARLQQAVEAFRLALSKRDRAKLPYEWASTHNNLGITLYALGQRESEPELLTQAEAAYRGALEVFTRGAWPLEWAMTANNLGNTLVTLGTNLNDQSRFDEAVALFTAAMEVRTRQHWPLLWGSSQLNLGNALNGLGRLELGTENIEKAAAAYRQALTVFDRKTSPLDWASAQNNLGAVLQTIGQRGRDITKLNESADAFRLSKRVYTRRELPADWAMSENNLGNTLQLIGNMTNDPKVLKEAISAYRNALKEFRREDNARQWALTQASLGATLQTLSGHEDMIPNLKQAVKARRAALEVLTVDNAPIEWATAQSGVGMSLLNLSNFEQGADYLPEAKAAFEAADRIFTRETQPLQWAFTQNNIGDVHWSLASRGGGKADYERAIELFEASKDGFKEAGYAMLIELADKKIGLVKEALAEL